MEYATGYGHCKLMFRTINIIFHFEFLFYSLIYSDVSYCKNYVTNQWYLFNDSSVEPANVLDFIVNS